MHATPPHSTPALPRYCLLPPNQGLASREEDLRKVCASQAGTIVLLHPDTAHSFDTACAMKVSRGGSIL